MQTHRNPVNVAVVYHSGYGHTAKQAQAVAEGAAQVTGATVQLIRIEEGTEPSWKDLEQADAIIFGAPTYMGGPSAQFKAFQDATSKNVFAAGSKWKDKVAAGFTNGASRSGDKLATLIQLALFAAQHGMHWVNLGLPPANNSSTGSESELNRHGFWLGAAAQSNADQDADIVPPEADLATARHLGRRVTTLAQQLVLGRNAIDQTASE
ncbi:flavodoxin family protein [Pseudomonas chlororaphis]|uniref:flavodoxin family protein n=1 Tax=Pseudomonas chlororaphis TaxID=587753 RepID=UPI001B30DA21|nr:flavodoxin family protein [Pseudomonas chlororaphis]MBP5059560.1 flavodoxin family protein [Pseudomonas chlororaphis]MBP5143438.1 flavodoxin family protein [Pseudomonas chlororaphis]QTT98268.1 flavodoxin family protein [Pseudomonas chlororaphis]